MLDVVDSLCESLYSRYLRVRFKWPLFIFSDDLIELSSISKPNFFDLYQGKKSKLKDLIEQWEKLLETIEKNT